MYNLQKIVVSTKKIKSFNLCNKKYHKFVCGINNFFYNLNLCDNEVVDLQI